MGLEQQSSHSHLSIIDNLSDNVWMKSEWSQKMETERAQMYELLQKQQPI